MAYSTVPKTKRDGYITLKDGTGTPVTLEVAYEDGNFSFSQQAQDYSQLVIMDRGDFAAIRKQDQQTITGSFAFHFRQFTDAGTGDVRDFITKSGGYSSNISTGSTGTPYIEFYCIDIVYTAEGTDVGDAKDHTATLSKCVCNLDFSEGDPSAFTLNFTCYGGVVMT
jgi:hypothetical protein